MVRREAKGQRQYELPFAGCASPAGESPVPVSAGAPGSRPQVSEGDLCARAGRQEPLRREQPIGPQHEVNPAASSHLQTGSRVAHVTAKATSSTPRPESVEGSGGVWGAARLEGGARNTRGPSARLWSQQADSYKPKAKSSGVQRESEGVVVPRIAVEQNTEGGKGPCGGRAGRGGKHEGMAGREIRSNHPRRRVPVDKVRQLRRRLWAAAKRSPERRFHALYDRICRSDVLREAWRRVKRNRGAAGVDRQTLAEVEALGVERLLEELRTELRAGEYRPRAVLRRYIHRLRGTIRYPGRPFWETA